jgi:hypothetical protein
MPCTRTDALRVDGDLVAILREVSFMHLDLLRRRIDATTPEALLYEVKPNDLGLVEYVVFQAAWDAENAEPPSLFGQTFTLVPSSNRYGLDPFYALHAWAWNRTTPVLSRAGTPRCSAQAPRATSSERASGPGTAPDGAAHQPRHR